MSAPEFERVLGEHEDYGLYSDAGGDTHYVCACDETKRPGTHRAHLAAALNAEVARWLAEASEYDRACAAIMQHDQLKARAEAAEATVARVRALADEWGDEWRMAPYAWFGNEIRAALDSR